MEEKLSPEESLGEYLHSSGAIGKEIWSERKSKVRILNKYDSEFYHDLAKRVIDNNSQISSSQEATDRISQLESQFNVDLSYDDSEYEQRFGKMSEQTKFIREWSRLSIMNQLNLLSDKEKTGFQKIEKQYDDLVKVIVDTTGKSRDEIQSDLTSLCYMRTLGIRNLDEVKEILIHGPLIKGFDESEEFHMGNQEVGDYLNNQFGTSLMRELKIAKITKDDLWQINFPETPEGIDIRNKLVVEHKLVKGLETDVCDDKESYLKTAKILEGVDKEEDLTHI